MHLERFKIKNSPPGKGDTLNPIPPAPLALWASAADPPGKKMIFYKGGGK